MTVDQGPYPAEYPVQFAVGYPGRPRNRLTSFFRIFVIIPILIVLAVMVSACGFPCQAGGCTDQDDPR